MYLNNEIKQLELKYETSFVVHKEKLKEYYRKNEDTHTHLKVRKTYPTTSAITNIHAQEGNFPGNTKV